MRKSILINSDLHFALKLTAIKNGITVKQATEQALRKWIKEHSKNNNKNKKA